LFNLNSTNIYLIQGRSYFWYWNCD